MHLRAGARQGQLRNDRHADDGGIAGPEGHDDRRRRVRPSNGCAPPRGDDRQVEHGGVRVSARSRRSTRSCPATTRNPYDTSRVTAGSSGGSAAGTAANFAAFGLASDTGRFDPRSGRAPGAGRPASSTMGLVSSRRRRAAEPRRRYRRAVTRPSPTAPRCSR